MKMLMKNRRMFSLTLPVLLYCFIASMTGYSQEVAPIDSGSYEQVDPAELNFEFKSFYHRSVVEKDGEKFVGKPIGGEVGELICNGKSIELASHKFEDGFIVTKDYGKIRIRTSTSAYSESFSVWLTPKQKEALKKLTSPEKHVREQPDPFVYDPIPKETEKLLVPSQYKQIQEAINAAKEGATIVVSRGRYYEPIHITNKSVTLRSENPGDPNMVASTIIDANGQETTVVLEDSNSKILGLNICGGYNENKGGGLRISGKSSPLIKGNIIEKNKTGTMGGGIVLIQSAEPRIIDNIIRHNKAQGGGGVYGISTTVYMKNNQIAENSVEKGGGGVWVQECGGVISGNTITKNKAEAGGGVYISQKSTVEVTKNTISENSATVGGGAFVIAYCRLLITENAFLGNKAAKSAGGIAVAVQSTCNLVSNKFERNEAEEAGVGRVEEATVNESNNVFVDNKPENKILK